MRLHVEAFLVSIKYMVEGMLGIFAVMAIIIGVILLLNRVTAKKENS